MQLDLARLREDVTDLRIVIEKLTETVRGHLRALHRERVGRTSELLTKREAARIYKLRRQSALKRLIDEGHLTPVPWGRYPKIRREDLERLKRDGLLVATYTKPRRPSEKASTSLLSSWRHPDELPERGKS